MSREPTPDPVIPIFVTQSEAVALGDTVLAYHQWLRSRPAPTEAQRAVAELLESFHERLQHWIPVALEHPIPHEVQPEEVFRC